MHPLIAIPAILALVYRAYSRKSLTKAGIYAAVLTAIIHAIHPWSIFLTLLVVFFLTGMAVTKVKQEHKATFTRTVGSPNGGGESPRGWIQVFANSGVASLLILLHAMMLRYGANGEEKTMCFPGRSLSANDILVFGILGNYVAVAADTFSSELGILARTPPRLVLAPWQIVPRGTNGGVTVAGLVAGLLGSFIISATTIIGLPFCSNSWSLIGKIGLLLAMTLMGVVGSVLDSIYGMGLQASIMDRSTGKIVEGEGGQRVEYVVKDKLRDDEINVGLGYDVLSNNGVNLLMAASIAGLSMYFASLAFGVDPKAIFV